MNFEYCMSKISHGLGPSWDFGELSKNPIRKLGYGTTSSYFIRCCRGSASPKSYTSHSSLEDKFPSNIRMAPIPECIKWNGGSRASVNRNQSECFYWNAAFCSVFVFIIAYFSESTCVKLLKVWFQEYTTYINVNIEYFALIEIRQF